MRKLAHRWPGFGDQAIQTLLDAAGLGAAVPLAIDGPLPVRIWSSLRLAGMPVARASELAV